MFDAHPPFQIDGNFGFTAGITEMLLQSHDGAIHILPALPDSWKKGDISGIKARGGFEIIELNWKENKIDKLTIKSTIGGNCRIRSYWPLKSNKPIILVENSSRNPNSFYTIPQVKKAIISKQATNTRKVYTYDIDTKPGEIITFNE